MQITLTRRCKLHSQGDANYTHKVIQITLTRRFKLHSQGDANYTHKVIQITLTRRCKLHSQGDANYTHKAIKITLTSDSNYTHKAMQITLTRWFKLHSQGDSRGYQRPLMISQYQGRPRLIAPLHAPRTRKHLPSGISGIPSDAGLNSDREWMIWSICREEEDELDKLVPEDWWNEILKSWNMLEYAGITNIRNEIKICTIQYELFNFILHLLITVYVYILCSWKKCGFTHSCSSSQIVNWSFPWSFFHGVVSIVTMRSFPQSWKASQGGQQALRHCYSLGRTCHPPARESSRIRCC